MAEPVRLRPLPSQDGTAKHGVRYPARDKEAAFQVYRQLRSLRKTAEELNVSASTLAEWSKAEGWVARADREDAEDVEAARTAIGGRALPALQRGIDRLTRIVDDPASKDLDAIRATELLGRFTGTLAAPNAGQPFMAEPKGNGARVVSLKELASLSPDELDAWGTGGGEIEPPA